MLLMAEPPKKRVRVTSRKGEDNHPGHFRTHHNVNWKRIDWSKSDQKIAVELGINKAHVNSARHALEKPQATHEQDKARQAFRDYLVANRRKARTLALPDLVRDSGVTISLSAAYRVALKLRMRGLRQNSSRYDDFWAQVNWALPDSDLSMIWKVERGNIQSKRKLLSSRETPNVLDEPKWTRLQFPHNEEYQEAHAAEAKKARLFRGPRPS